jgi:hypothetical protein
VTERTGSHGATEQRRIDTQGCRFSTGPHRVARRTARGRSRSRSYEHPVDSSRGGLRSFRDPTSRASRACVASRRPVEYPLPSFNTPFSLRCSVVMPFAPSLLFPVPSVPLRSSFLPPSGSPLSWPHEKPAPAPAIRLRLASPPSDPRRAGSVGLAVATSRRASAEWLAPRDPLGCPPSRSPEDGRRAGGLSTGRAIRRRYLPRCV